MMGREGAWNNAMGPKCFLESLVVGSITSASKVPHRVT
jgi:hypothetical protein